MTSCRICSSTTIRQLHPDKKYHHCEQCDFIFLDQTHIISRAEERTRYLQHNNTMENAGYVQMFQDFIVNALEPQFSSSKTILDFGCGPNPVFAQILKQQSKQVDYYDPYFYPSQEYLNRQYDIITMTEAIEHIQYPLKTLALLKARLKPLGLLSVMTRLHRGVSSFGNWWYRSDNTHISFFSVKTAKFLSKELDMTFLRTDSDKFFCLQKRD